MTIYEWTFSKVIGMNRPFLNSFNVRFSSQNCDISPGSPVIWEIMNVTVGSDYEIIRKTTISLRTAAAGQERDSRGGHSQPLRVRLSSEQPRPAEVGAVSGQPREYSGSGQAAASASLSSLNITQSHLEQLWSWENWVKYTQSWPLESIQEAVMTQAHCDAVMIW